MRKFPTFYVSTLTFITYWYPFIGFDGKRIRTILIIPVFYGYYFMVKRNVINFILDAFHVEYTFTKGQGIFF